MGQGEVHEVGFLRGLRLVTMNGTKNYTNMALNILNGKH